jgi:hypothetical protein
VVLFYPEALNQHPSGPMDIVRVLGFSILAGLWIYIAVLSSLCLHGLIFKRRTLRTIHRASAAMGVAFVLIPQTMYVPRLIPGNVGGGIEVGLMILIFLTALGVAIRIFRRGDTDAKIRQTS